MERGVSSFMVRESALQIEELKTKTFGTGVFSTLDEVVGYVTGGADVDLTREYREHMDKQTQRG